MWIHRHTCKLVQFPKRLPGLATILMRPSALQLNAYPRDWKKDEPGLVLIVSMEGNRRGGAADRGRLENLFKVLRFRMLETQIDIPAEVLRDTIRDLAQSPALKDVDSFVFCISAHGGTDDGRGYIEDSTLPEDVAQQQLPQQEASFSGGLDSNEGTLPQGPQQRNRLQIIDDIVNPICASKHLRGKPKIFLINACRGPHAQSRNPYKKAPAKETKLLSELEMGQYITNKEDVLLIFSTDEGDMSFRHETNGTFFVQSLQKITEARFEVDDVLGMITAVAEEMRRLQTDQGLTQRLCCHSYLLKKVYWRRAPAEYGESNLLSCRRLSNFDKSVQS
jgi:hypothetical protein